jgi:hypothetical protein
VSTFDDNVAAIAAAAGMGAAELRKKLEQPDAKTFRAELEKTWTEGELRLIGRAFAQGFLEGWCERGKL